ncbi:MAG: hypothetical protein WBD09_11060 [Halobacteriota archaeon]
MPNEESYLNVSLRKIVKGAGFVFNDGCRACCDWIALGNHSLCLFL